MKPTNFKESNKLLKKPNNMTDEECGSLYVWTDEKFCLSCWKPTIKERLSIMFFGKIWVWLLSGSTQPPIALDVTRTVFKNLEVNDDK